MYLTFRIFSIDHLSDIFFAEIIYISLLLKRSVSSKMTNLHYIDKNSLLKYITDVYVLK